MIGRIRPGNPRPTFNRIQEALSPPRNSIRKSFSPVRHENALFLGLPGSGKSHLAQAIGQAVIQQGYRVFYRETHALLEEIADATLDGTRKECLESVVTVPLLIIDDFGMRKLPLTAAEELLELTVTNEPVRW